MKYKKLIQKKKKKKKKEKKEKKSTSISLSTSINGISHSSINQRQFLLQAKLVTGLSSQFLITILIFYS